MSKYIISVGHTASGNIGSGAVGKLNESNCTREIAPLVVSKLQLLGHEAIKLQVDESNSRDFVVRTNQANSIGCDLFIEIHLNSGINYSGDGVEVLTTSNSSAISTASNISRAISSATGITNRGHKTTNGLYVLNHTSMASCLVECCFVDGTNWSNYNAEIIATAIVNGITGQDVNTTNRKLGWNKNSTGWWYCTDVENGYYYTSNNGWKEIDGKWYIFDSQGYTRQSMWYYDDDTKYWYWLKEDCSMASNEWISYNDDSYYLGDKGGMYKNSLTPDGYTVDENGAWIQSIPRK